MQDIILYEKYRPKKIEDLIFERKDALINIISNPKKIQSMIFHGESGCGKTSTAELIASLLEADVIRINGSNDTSIEIIRDKVVTHLSLQSLNLDSMKIVIINEAEMLSSNAQKALKDIIEEYNKKAFFIFTTNNLLKVDEAIKSRCLLFSFDNPSKELIANRLNYIISNENLQITNTIENIIDCYYPDIRAMISSLENNLISNSEEDFINFKKILCNQDVNAVYKTVNENKIDIQAFLNWFFNYIFKNWKRLIPDNEKKSFELCGKLVFQLAEIEKAKKMNIDIKKVGLAYFMKIMEIFNTVK